jgi:tRNA (guanine-N(7)-)-methyltransferase
MEGSRPLARGRRNLSRFAAATPPDGVLSKYVIPMPRGALYHSNASLPLVSARALFGCSCPLVIDIGCGQAEFLLHHASSQPQTTFVGVDFHWKSLFVAVTNAAGRGLENVRFLRTDARYFWSQVPMGSVSEIWYLFPPPIARHKHRNKDVLSEALLAQAVRALVVGGHIIFATDHGQFFSEKMELFSNQARLVRSVEQALDVDTRYNRIWSNHGFRALVAGFRRAL